MSGYYRMERGWLDHPVFKSQPYSRHAAWAWLIERAMWRATKMDICGNAITLERGQLSYSIRYMAEAWKWPKSVVERFINRLRTETMIATEAGQGKLVITICNYDKYQFTEDDTRDDNNQGCGTPAGHQRDTSGTNKKELKGLKESKISMIDPNFDRDFSEWWALYPHKVARKAAEKAYATARKKVSREKLISGLTAYVENKPSKSWANGATWLNGERWADGEEDTGPALPLLNGMNGHAREHPDIALWRSRIETWDKLGRGYWPVDTWGASPDDPRCECPPGLLAEFAAAEATRCA